MNINMGNLAHALMGAQQGYNGRIDRERQLAREDEEKLARQEEREARAEQRAFMRTQNARALKEQAREDEKRDALAAAGAPLAIEDGTMPQHAFDDDGNPTISNPKAFKVDGKSYATMPAATQAASAGQLDRLTGAMMKYGDVTGANQLRSSAYQLESQRLAAEKGAREAAAQKFFSRVGGDWKKLAGAYKEYDDGFDVQVIEDGKGGAKVISMKDGKPSGEQVFASMNELNAHVLATIDPKFGIEHAERKRATVEREEDRKWGREIQERQVDATIANQRAQRAEAGLRITMMQEQRRAEQKRLDEDGRVPVSVKTAYATINKELEQIGRAMTDSMAKDTWNPDSKGAQDLLTRQRELGIEGRRLLAPYLPPGAEKTGGDPLNLMGGVEAKSAQKQVPNKAGATVGGQKQPPVDRLKDQPIGRLTPMAMIIESAAAGNQKAQQYLRASAEAPQATPGGGTAAGQLISGF